jgi:hypothetical protein
LNCNINFAQVAVTCGLPVMSLSWIDFAWENRFDPSFKANAPEVVEKFKLQPFSSLYLAFYNFCKNDMQEIEDLTVKNGSCSLFF